MPLTIPVPRSAVMAVVKRTRSNCSRYVVTSFIDRHHGSWIVTLLIKLIIWNKRTYILSIKTVVTEWIRAYKMLCKMYPALPQHEVWRANNICYKNVSYRKQIARQHSSQHTSRSNDISISSGVSKFLIFLAPFRPRSKGRGVVDPERRYPRLIWSACASWLLYDIQQPNFLYVYGVGWDPKFGIPSRTSVTRRFWPF